MPNGDTKYKLGELEQFKNNTIERLTRIEKKVDNLTMWRWKTLGAISVLAVIGNFAISLILKQI